MPTLWRFEVRWSIFGLSPLHRIGWYGKGYGKKLPKGSITSPGARLDVSARNLWFPLAKAFIDVRVVNPQVKANWEKSIPQM